MARLDGDPITAAELEGSGPLARRLDPRRALDAAIARQLAAREARRRGLDRTSEVAAQIEALRREVAAREQALLRDALFASTRDALALGDEELRAYYEKTKVRYTERRLRLRRAAFPSEDAARAADTQLGVAGRLDPGSSDGIGPAVVAELPQAVLPEALRLREAGARVVVERDGSFALVELVEILPAETRPFEEVRPQLEHELRTLRGSEAFAELLDSLRAGARIEIDDRALRESSAGSPGAGPALRR